MFLIINYLIYIIPAVVFLFFIISLVLYLKAKKDFAGTADEKEIERLNKLKSLVRVSGIIAAVFLAVVIICTVLFFMLIAYM